MIESDRFVSAENLEVAPQDTPLDRAIRPTLLKDYEGQPAVREQMEIFIGAAKARKEPLDHTLIFGPPGLDKTLSLIHI